MIIITTIMITIIKIIMINWWQKCIPVRSNITNIVTSKQVERKFNAVCYTGTPSVCHNSISMFVIINSIYISSQSEDFPWAFKHRNITITYPDRKVHGVNMGPTWVLSAPDGSHEHCYQGRVWTPFHFMYATLYGMYDDLYIYVYTTQWPYI